jgi:hypothetical protein
VASILKGWTTEANILEGSRTNEVELIEIIADTKTRQNQKPIMFFTGRKEQELYLGMLTVSPELQK